MKKFRYTLIIPHYALPGSLGCLLESLPQRKDLQVVVVDDGSDASTLGKVRELCETYSNVSLLVEENGGAGSARNKGLTAAEGEWILFADADDRFLPALSQLLDEVERSGENDGNASERLDVIYFNAACKHEDPKQESFKTAHLNWMMQQTEEVRDFHLRYLFTEPWCKLIRRSLIDEHAIRFEETRIQNDVLFSISVGHFARRIEVFTTPVYLVNDRSGSVAKQISPERYLEWTGVQTRQNLFFRQNGVNYFEYKALRPMLNYFVHGHWNLASRCAGVLKQEGELSSGQIFLRTLAYPFALVRKVMLKRRQRKSVIHP